ncbi:MAG: hypothetical protein OP8BY_1664 [Candidatus Saccharicenans subterraneus]|uniref:Uncharacterized protein n=1 Tax=Candidatus Saccharicenans subterraneus TaxID=2508984 RepID=A0A3E2BPC1_9BACT|nr:MAG: hypothetical protein OP8BY_1664 [Candidatus Saccharicenans subterraneum]
MKGGLKWPVILILKNQDPGLAGSGNGKGAERKKGAGQSQPPAFRSFCP